MDKTLTLRLTKEEYEKIAALAKQDHRPISNFITHIVLNTIDEDYYVDEAEMRQINSDKKLLGSLKKAHGEADTMKGKFVD